MYILGVDIGTTNTKVIAYTPEGRSMAGADMSNSPLSMVAGYHELDPAMILKAVVKTMQDVRMHMGKEPLVGCCFSSAMHSLLAVDAAGRPLTNLITWADNRSSAQAAALKATAKGNEIYNRTGTPIHPMSPLCKLLWMKEEQPALHAAAAKFIGIKEYLFFHFFGQYVIDHSIASATGLFDIYDLGWNETALREAGITPEKLSTPVSTSHAVTGLKQEYVDLLSIPADTPFIIGASDGCLANLGSGAMQPGDVSITVGTSGAVRMTAHQPQQDAQQRIFNYILTEDLYISGGPINNGAMLLKWCAEQLFSRPFNNATDDAEWFLEQAAKAPAGCDGLIFLPYIQGERAPVWDANARGVFFGIGTQHTQAHFMRAVIEGINFALYEVMQAVEESVGPVKRIYASGGFSRSQQWVQWLADLLGQDILLSGTADASAMGAALLGLHAMGITSSLALPAMSDISITSGKRTTGEIKTRELIRHYQPSPQQREVYLHNYNIYKTLYASLQVAFHKM